MGIASPLAPSKNIVFFCIKCILKSQTMIGLFYFKRKFKNAIIILKNRLSVKLMEMVQRRPEQIDPDLLAEYSEQYMEDSAEIIIMLTKINQNALALEVNLASIIKNVANAFDKVTRSINPEWALMIWPD